MKDRKLRKMGIEVIGDAPWGTHFCLFYQTKEDLIDILVPYFKAGLENNEFCMWVTSEPLNVEDAERALQRVVKNLHDCIEQGQIEILDYSQWYTKSGRFDADEVLQGWVEKEAQAVKSGFEGLRLTGNTFWLEERDWEAFTNYEAEIDRVIGQYRMLAICTYSLDRCRASEVIDVVSNHAFALIKREGKWETIESARRKRAEEALGERMKELTCLYAVSRDMQEGLSTDELCRRVIEHLVPAVQFPEITVPVIELDGRRFTSKRYTEGLSHGLHAEIRVEGEAHGHLWVYYAEERPFLIPEEQNLVNSVAEALGLWLERKQAEEALRESEASLARAQQIAHLGNWDWDVKDQTLTWSDEIYRIFGVEKGFELTYEGIEAMIHPHDRAKNQGYVNELLTATDAAEIEFRMIRPDGAVRHIYQNAEVSRDEAGNVSRIFGIIQDITERKRAEEALRVSEERFALAVQGSNAGIWDWDIKNNTLYWSPRMKELLGYADDELDVDFDTFESHLHPDDREHTQAAIEAHLKDRELYEVEQRLRTKSGEYRWFLARGQALWDESGNPIRAVGSTTDITDRKRAEEALREAKEFSDSLITSMKDGFSVLDTHGVHIDVNPALCQMTGFSREELIGVGPPHPYWPPEAYEEIERAFLKTLRGEFGDFELTLMRKNGQRFPVIVSPSWIKDKQRNVISYFSTVKDITERKRAEEEVRRHLERAEALREIDRAITSTLDLSGVLDIILQELERVIPYHSAGIFLFSDGTARLTAGRGFPDLERVLQISYPVQEDALTRQVLQERRPLVLADAQTDERFLARGGTEYVRSWIGIPLIVKGRAVGFLTVDHREPGIYGEESAEIAQRFASQAAIAIENARLFQEAQRELAERKRVEEELLQRQLRLSVLNRMGRALAGKLELAPIYRIAYEYVAQLVDCPCFGISLYDPTTRILRAEFMLDDGKLIDVTRFPPLVMDMEPTRGRVRAIATRQPEIIVDYPTVTEGSDVHLIGAPGDDRVVGSAMYVPMIVWGQVMGLLEVQSYQLDAYSAEEAELLGPAANQIGLSIQNARLYEEAQRELAERKQAQEELRQSYVRLEQTLEGTISTLVLTIEGRDPYTAGHQRRVTQLACAIANEMHLPQEQIEGLRMAGLTHDIGKINIPAEILSKPGQLTDLEFGLIRMHPQTGHDILKAIEFPWPVAQMVLQHHERMDGSGYPQRLSGEEILLEARILGVADVVEAMASHRPYRSARGIDQALEEISQNKGVLYDAEIVDACLKLFTEKDFRFE